MRVLRSVSRELDFLLPLVYLTLVSTGFFVAGAISNHSIEFWYFIWNLFLAWLPIFFVLWLLNILKRKPWSSWQGIIATLLWVGFLPNSFYMVSDLIHLQDYQRVDIVYDTVMFASFVITGLLLGYVSLYIVHAELVKRIKTTTAWLWVGVILGMCSFAIYLGRDLRWNTWDVLINPAGILFDISEPFIHPTTHYLAFTTTLTFFVFLGSLYVAIRQFTYTFARHNRSDA